MFGVREQLRAIGISAVIAACCLMVDRWALATGHMQLYLLIELGLAVVAAICIGIAVVMLKRHSPMGVDGHIGEELSGK